MALFNYATKEITLKIVYYGPGLSGKTTNLQYLHSVLNPDTKGKLLSLSTESDRTLFFDFLPIELGKIRDFSIRFQLYTVPGQVRYNATRKVVLKGVDGIVFVADSQREMREQNMESFANMRDNLIANNLNPDEIPVVLQYNKRDLKNICTIDELNIDLNHYNYNVTEATAVNGRGVEDSFRLITKLLLKYISKKHKIEIQPASPAEELSEEVPHPEPEAEPEPSAALADLIPPVEITLPEPEVELEPSVALADLIPPVEIPVPEPRAEPEPHLAARSALVPEYSTEIDKVTAVPAEAEIRGTAPVTTSDTAVDAMKEVINGLSDRMDKMAHEVAELSEALQGLQKTLADLSSGMKDVREVKKGQADMLSSLKGLTATFESLKEKKSWFKF